MKPLKKKTYAIETVSQKRGWLWVRVNTGTWLRTVDVKIGLGLRYLRGQIESEYRAYAK